MYDVGTDRLSWRRLAVLVERLPREALTVRARFGEVVDWGPVEHLLADVFDAVQQSTWVLTAANSKKRPKPPRLRQRPGVAAAPVPGVGRMAAGRGRSVAEMRKILDNWDRPDEFGLTVNDDVRKVV